MQGVGDISAPRLASFAYDDYKVMPVNALPPAATCEACQSVGSSATSMPVRHIPQSVVGQPARHGRQPAMQRAWHASELVVGQPACLQGTAGSQQCN
jgi:hypothetical protein